VTRTPRRCTALDHRAEIAIAAKQHHLVEMLGSSMASRSSMSKLPFPCAPAGVDELLGRLVTNVCRCVEQSASPDRGNIPILDDGGVIKPRTMRAAALEIEQQPLVIDSETKGFAVAKVARREQRELVVAVGIRLFLSFLLCGVLGAADRAFQVIVGCSARLRGINKQLKRAAAGCINATYDGL